VEAVLKSVTRQKKSAFKEKMFYMTLILAALFFVLTPGILVSLPPGGSKMTVALTHAAVFALVWHFLRKPLKKLLY